MAPSRGIDKDVAIVCPMKRVLYLNQQQQIYVSQWIHLTLFGSQTSSLYVVHDGLPWLPTVVQIGSCRTVGVALNAYGRFSQN